MVWKVLNRTSLFSDRYLKKYFSLWAHTNQKHSQFWKSPRNIAIEFKDYFSCAVGLNSTLSLFYDPWCNGKALYDLAGNHILHCLVVPIDSRTALIHNSGWNLPSSPRNCSCRLLITFVPLNTDSDTFYWNGQNSISSVVIKDKLYSGISNVPWADLIWFKGYAINLAIFTWMAFIKGLKTI